MRLFFIIVSQFFSGSIWFAGNVAYADQSFLLSAVQSGFILGTLVFAFLNLSDRFPPTGVFFCCAMGGALFNYWGIFLDQNQSILLFSRVMCGISLAGIYPVGMKIAASWYPKTIGKALGWLVGSLVLACGFPYFVNMLNWQGHTDLVLQVTSALCFSGGFISLIVGNGPHLPRGSKFKAGVLKEIFRHPGFRASSFGYFGHQWELYAVFAYIPLLIKAVGFKQVDLWSFVFFVAGCLGCIIGGILSQKIGSRLVALVSLFGSAMICLISPVIADLPSSLALCLILSWGVLATADSPQFSSLNTQFAPKAYVGSALTIVNCIGFLITIITIELLAFWIEHFGIRYAFLLLTIGPAIGWHLLRQYPCQFIKPEQSYS